MKLVFISWMCCGIGGKLLGISRISSYGTPNQLYYNTLGRGDLNGKNDPQKLTIK